MSAAHRVAIAILSLLSSLACAAPTPQSLINAGALRASLLVETPAPHYQRAPLVLTVEVATARWFSRGTRVRDFRVEGALVRPVSNFADNQTRREGTASWSVQRWRFRLYPLETGILALPAVKVFVSVNHDEGEIVEGELILNREPLSIAMVPGTEDLENWVATPQLAVEEHWEGRRDSYRPGDAITRWRDFEISDAPGMMLSAAPLPDVEGLSLYAAPTQVSERSNRGQLTGIRKEELVVTFEQAGDYQLPGATYHWFNTQSGLLETLSLPDYHFSVTGAAPDQQAIPGRDPVLRQWAAVIGWLITALALLMGLWRLPPLKRLARLARERWRRARRQRAYRAAIARGDSPAALRLLHQGLVTAGSANSLRQASADDAIASKALRQLLAHAYGSAQTLPESESGLRLWQAATRTRGSKRATLSALSLNPRTTPR